MKWEYRLYPADPNRGAEQLEDALNELGKGGWEVVAVFVNAVANNFFVLKRQLQKDSRSS